MTTTLDAILDAQGEQLALDELLAAIAEEERDTCPLVQHCVMRRAALPTYRQHQPCHWLAFALGGDSWKRCPTYRNGDKK